jgi:hypothetical protein
VVEAATEPRAQRHRRDPALLLLRPRQRPRPRDRAVGLALEPAVLDLARGVQQDLIDLLEHPHGHRRQPFRGRLEQRLLVPAGLRAAMGAVAQVLEVPLQCDEMRGRLVR